MKMKYITPAITVMEAIMETYLLGNSTEKGGTGEYGDGTKDNIKDTDENVDMGAKDYNAWEAWDSF